MFMSTNDEEVEEKDEIHDEIAALMQGQIVGDDSMVLPDEPLDLDEDAKGDKAEDIDEELDGDGDAA